MQFDTTILVFVLGLVVTTVALVYRDYRFYDVLDKSCRGLIVVSIAAGAGFSAGAYYFGKELAPLIDPTKVASVKTLMQNYTTGGAVIGTLAATVILALAILMYVEAKLGRDHRAQPQAGIQ